MLVAGAELVSAVASELLGDRVPRSARGAKVRERDIILPQRDVLQSNNEVREVKREENVGTENK